MKIASAAYPLAKFHSWDDYATNITSWVADAADQGADLLVFPEYSAMELASLNGDAALEIEPALAATASHLPAADELHDALARRFGVHILAGSAPAYDPCPRPVNRARLFGPDGPLGAQDKQIMTMVERDMDVHPGAPLQVFDTPLARLGVLICYDVEFPDLGRALVEAGVEVILAPSYTEGPSGYWRVRIGAMARALEGQCVSVQAPCLSDGVACPAMGTATGAAGVFGPPDLGFPETGILALGKMGEPGWVMADVPRDAIARVRAEGRVRNFTYWEEQALRLNGAETAAAE